MYQVRLASHVGADGVLHIDVPTDMRDVDIEVTITAAPRRHDDADWQEFVTRTYGSFRDAPLAREPQGEYDQRDELA
jgi:hypothetical protein